MQEGYDSYLLIADYSPSAYYAAEKDGKYFLVTVHEGTTEASELPDASALENKALEILNEDCQPEVDGVYLPMQGLEKYFTQIEALEDYPGCYTGIRSEQPFIIVPRYIIEYDNLEKDQYYPLLFAHVYPPEEEREEMFSLLYSMLHDQTPAE